MRRTNAVATQSEVTPALQDTAGEQGADLIEPESASASYPPPALEPLQEELDQASPDLTDLRTAEASFTTDESDQPSTGKAAFDDATRVDTAEAGSGRAPRRRGQRGRRGRGGRSGAALASAEGNGIDAAAVPESDDRFLSPEYEPLPPPTKRKVPRVIAGMHTPNTPQAENAVDWALGRRPVENLEAGIAPEEDTSISGRRRRSRRGRRGQGSPIPLDEQQEHEARPSLVPEERFLDAQQRRPQAQPVRDDRNRGQLSTFESLVARQNVVLDTLLTRISSFTSIERALTAVEHRLSNQGYGAAGTAAPRVGIFVDVPNIIYAAERIGITIDFGKLLNLLTRGRELVRASAYAPISDDPQQRLESQKFVQPFIRGGYRIVTKPLKRFSDGSIKGNFDVELALDVLTMADRLDVVSLISGDGDFSRLVDLVGSRGVRVEVIAFGGSTSAELRAICDDYVDLGAILDQVT